MSITLNSFLFAFSITLLAGLSTGFGSIIIFLKKEISDRFLAASLGFSAGVMLLLSLFEILPHSNEILTGQYGTNMGAFLNFLAFFAGMGLISLLNKIVPEVEMDSLTSLSSQDSSRSKVQLYRAGLLTAIAMAIHNFPEGFISFMGTFHDPKFGLTIAFAIAVHNIPEGIAVAIPIYSATGSKAKAVLISFLSGMTEPLGAVLGFLLLRPFINEIGYGIIFSIVAGIMSYISFGELLPLANSYGDHQTVNRGLIAGMVLIALSLVISM